MKRANQEIKPDLQKIIDLANSTKSVNVLAKMRSQGISNYIQIYRYVANKVKSIEENKEGEDQTQKIELKKPEEPRESDKILPELNKVHKFHANSTYRKQILLQK